MAGKGSAQNQMGGKILNEGSRQQQHQGDERTPDKPIGQVVYANRDPARKKRESFKYRVARMR
jgi:hypothetical protein